ncbi:GGDEF domain-containing protein [Virgibacillus xinjiangensis]|uniref:GGDEF domain-containing protein n=1 Tax=Virgibacillus xinjiangensis TaxID=393090 RepID=A0ABV7CYV5_9BACI
MRVLTFCLFVGSAIIAILYGKINVELSIFLPALALFLIFSYLNWRLNAKEKTLRIDGDQGLSYGLALVLIVGPAGAFLFETIYRFLLVTHRKIAFPGKKAKFLHAFYTIGAYSLIYSMTYFLFHLVYPFLEPLPFDFWLLLAILVVFTAILSDILLSLTRITGQIHIMKAIAGFLQRRSPLELGRTMFSNGLLTVFFMEQHWELVIILFLLNYTVTRSFFSNPQTVRHKIERDKFEAMAYTDFLTQVHNRTYMDKVMGELNKMEERMAVVVADIDDFKQTNDTFNHHVGDQVILHAANTFSSCLTKDDYLFRSGGEEFTFIFRGKSYHECVSQIQGIQTAMQRNPAKADYHMEDLSIYLTCSYGMFFFEASKHLDIKEAYIYADDLLLHSKDTGKNRLTSVNSLVVSEMDMESITKRDEILSGNLPNSNGNMIR